MSIYRNLSLRNFTLPKIRVTASQTGEVIETPGLPWSVLSASALTVLLGLALPLTILQVYDRVLPNKSTDTLLVLAIGVVAVLLLDATLKIMRGFVVSWLAASFSHKAHMEAMRRILYARSETRARMSVSRQIEELKALQSLADHYASPSRLLVIDLPASLIFLALLFVIGGPIGFVPIALILVFTLLTSSINGRLQGLVESRAQLDQRKYDFLLEVLAGLTTIKAMALEPMIMRRFERLQRTVSEEGQNYIEWSNNARDISTLFTGLTTVFIVAVGAVLVIHEQLSIGAVAACTLLAGQVMQPLLRGVNYWTDMQRINHDHREASRLFELPPEDAHPETAAAIEGHITLQRVSCEGKSGVPLDLSDSEIRIEACETVALAGPDGSGRSALLRLISGDMQPTSGKVLIDDLDLFGDDHQSLRRRIAYVGQEAQVFTGTILQNLTLFGSRADPNKARLAADLIGLERDIHLLPQGYDTMLGAGLDENLTASFLQRIAIARALASEPEILLLDNANGVLDMPGEAGLLQGLTRIKGQLTILLASHRPSFRAIADREIRLERGRLAPPPADKPAGMPRTDGSGQPATQRPAPAFTPSLAMSMSGASTASGYYAPPRKER